MEQQLTQLLVTSPIAAGAIVMAMLFFKYLNKRDEAISLLTKAIADNTEATNKILEHIRNGRP